MIYYVQVIYDDSVEWKLINMPDEEREFDIVNGQYDDDDASHLPLLDEGGGFWNESDDEE